jgi:hypothetical protein
MSNAALNIHIRSLCIHMLLFFPRFTLMSEIPQSYGKFTLFFSGGTGVCTQGFSFAR